MFIKKNFFGLLIAGFSLLSVIPVQAQVLQAQDEVKFSPIVLPTVNVDYGTADVETILFEAKTTGNTEVVGFLFQGEGSFDSTHIDSISLYERHGNGARLLTDTVPGTLIGNQGTLYLDESNTSINMNPNETTQFRLDVDLVDSISLPDAKFAVRLRKARVQSIPSLFPAQVYGLPLSSNNIVYINASQPTPANVNVDPLEIDDQYTYAPNDNIWLTKFDVTTDQDIVFTEVAFQGIISGMGEGLSSDTFEDIEIYYINEGITFEADEFDIGSNGTAYFYDMDIEIEEGEIHEFILRGDIIENPANTEISVGMLNAVFEDEATLLPSNVIGVPYTPVNSVFILDSGIDVEADVLNNIDVNLGDENIDLIDFTFITGFGQEAWVEELTFFGSNNFDGDHISAIRLWKRNGNTWELIDIDGGFDIENGEIEFDDFDEVYIPELSVQTFLVTVDISENPSIVNDIISPVSLIEAEVSNSYNDEFIVNGLPASSERFITIH